MIQISLIAAAASIAAISNTPAKEAPSFTAKATNGATYSAKSFLKKPALLVFLNHECPHSKAATPDLNRLRKQIAGQVQLIAVTDLDLAAAKKYGKEIKADFPLLADPDKKILKAFGGKFSLDFTTVSGKDKPTFPQIWEGYSRARILEALKGLPGGEKAFAKLDLSYLPADRQSGCQF